MIACYDVAMLLWSCGSVNSTLGLGGGHPLHAVQAGYVVAVLASTGQPLAGVAARCYFRQRAMAISTLVCLLRPQPLPSSCLHASSAGRLTVLLFLFEFFFRHALQAEALANLGHQSHLCVSLLTEPLRALRIIALIERASFASARNHEASQ